MTRGLPPAGRRVEDGHDRDARSVCARRARRRPRPQPEPGFHIIFACFGIAFPTVLLIAHWIGLRRGDPVALLLARRWSKVMAVIFAVGAVSGTVLSYELGLLRPTLMALRS